MGQDSEGPGLVTSWPLGVWPKHRCPQAEARCRSGEVALG